MFKLILFLILFTFPALAEFNPQIKVLKVSDKISAYVMPDNRYPIMSISLYFKTGYLEDEINGLSRLFVAMLDEGAGEYDSLTLQKVLYENGIEFNAEVTDEILAISMTFLKEKQELSFSLLGKILKEPRFEKDAMERIKKQLVSVIRRNRKSPSEIASQEWKKTAFMGTVHARSSLGSEEDLNKITEKDLHLYRKNRLAKDNVYIGIAGYIDDDKLSKGLETVFAGFPEHAKTVRVHDTSVKSLPQPKKIFYDSPQSVIIFGHDGLRRLDKDYYAAVVADYILGGGGFSSRLIKEIREKRGLVYGISTWMKVSDTAPLIMGYVGTSTDNVDKVISLIKDEWQLIVAKGVSEKEVADAKNYLLGAFPFKFSSSELIAKILSSIQIQNLGLNYFNDYIDGFKKVTAEDVNRTVGRLYDVNKLLFTIVGKN